MAENKPLNQESSELITDAPQPEILFLKQLVSAEYLRYSLYLRVCVCFFFNFIVAKST